LWQKYGEAFNGDRSGSAGSLRSASGPLTPAKGMLSGDAAFKEIVADRALTVLRRLAKSGMAVKSGTSRDAKWALKMHVFWHRGDAKLRVDNWLN
jgi:hypothetical protein